MKRFQKLIPAIVLCSTMSVFPVSAETLEESASETAKGLVTGAAIAGGGAAVGFGIGAATVGAGAVVHSSGAAIATVGGGYVAGMLGTIGAGMLAAASAPVWIIGGVVVAGAGAACWAWC